MRAAIYNRISDEGEDTGNLRRHREQCETLAEREGYEYDPATDLYEDGFVSAHREDAERPAFDKLLANLDRYDVVVAKETSRLSRQSLQAHRFRDAAVRSGVAYVHTVSRGRFDVETDLLRWSIEVAQDETESRKISERVTDAHAEYADQGRWRGGPLPFGWTSVPAHEGKGQVKPPKGRVLVLDDDEAPWLREAVDRLTDGESAGSIAREWNQGDGPGNRKGGDWSSGNLLEKMRDPLLRGYAKYKGDVVTDDDGAPLQTHEPLVTAAEWRRLQEALDGRSFTRRASNEHLLAGLARCAECGETMYGNRNGDVYQCRVKYSERFPDKSCPGNAIRKSWLDEWVSLTVAGWLRREDVIARYHASRMERDTEHAEEVAALQEERERLVMDRDRLLDDRAAGVYDGPDMERRFRKDMRQVNAALERLEQEVAEARTVVEARFDATVYDMLDRAHHFPDLDPSERRNDVLRMVREVQVSKAAHRGKNTEPAMVARVQVVPTEEWAEALESSSVAEDMGDDWASEQLREWKRGLFG